MNNDKQWKIAKKSQNGCVTTWGPNNVRSPRFKTYSDKEFLAILTPQKPFEI